jgi:hypothetical protein
MKATATTPQTPTTMRAIKGTIMRARLPQTPEPTATWLPAGAAGALAWSKNLPGWAICRFKTAVSAREPKLKEKEPAGVMLCTAAAADSGRSRTVRAGAFPAAAPGPS